MALWTIFEVCAQHKTGYEGGGRIRPPVVAADMKPQVRSEDTSA